MGASSGIRQKPATCQAGIISNEEIIENLQRHLPAPKASMDVTVLAASEPSQAADGTDGSFRSWPQNQSKLSPDINKLAIDWSRQSTPSTVAPEDNGCEEGSPEEDDDDDDEQPQEQREQHENWRMLPGVVRGSEESADEGVDVDTPGAATNHAEDVMTPSRVRVRTGSSPMKTYTSKGSVASGLLSPKATSGKSYIERWTDPDETLILFDFDDTLCPSSHMLGHPGSKAGADPLLQTHEAAAAHLLKVASSLGHVQIVTMADEEWVERCISDLMPGLRSTLTELNIPVSGARSNVPFRSMREAHADAREPSHFLKTRVMKRIIRNFYGKGRRSQRSWKNILSIGDSEAERLALQDIVFRRIQKDRDGSWKECRCKTLLLLPEPKLTELTAELKVVAQLLPALVHHDGDLDMDLNEDELEFALQDH